MQKNRKIYVKLGRRAKNKKRVEEKRTKGKKIRKKFDGHLSAFDGHFGYKEEKCGIVQKSENFCLQF